MKQISLLDLLNQSNTIVDTDNKPVALGNVAPYKRNEEGHIVPSYRNAFNHIEGKLFIEEQSFSDYGTGNSKLHGLIEKIQGDDVLKERIDHIVKAKACNEQYLFTTAGYACITALVTNDSRCYANLATLCKVAQAMQCTYVAHAIVGVFCAKSVEPKEKGEGFMAIDIPVNYLKRLEYLQPMESVEEYARRIQALFFPEFWEAKKSTFYGVSRNWNNQHVSELNKFFFLKEGLELVELKANVDKLVKQFDKYFADDTIRPYAYAALVKYVNCHSGNNK